MATAHLRKHIPARTRRPIRKCPLLRVRREVLERPVDPDTIPMTCRARDAFSLGELLGSLYANSQKLDLAALEAFVRGAQLGFADTEAKLK